MLTKKLVTKLVALGTVGLSGAALAGESFTKEVSFTSEYVLVEANGDSSSPVDETNDSAVVIGKPGGQLTPATSANDECGKYFNGMSYSNSSNFSGTAYETFMVLNDGRSSGDKDSRIPLSTWVMGARPNKGKKQTSFTLYKEHVNDDGRCVQGGKTYDKYTVTMD